MALSGQRLKQVVVEYLDYCSIERGFTAKTLRGKKEVFCAFQKFIENKEFDLELLRVYMKSLRDRGLANSSIRVHMRNLKAFVTWLCEREYIKENWGLKIQLPKVEEQIKELVPFETAEKIILEGTKPLPGDSSSLHKETKKEHRIALRFVIRTGLRISEVINLEGKNLNIENGEFWVKGKGGKVGLLPLPRDLISALEGRVENERVFNVNEAGLNGYLRRGCEALGIKKTITCHSLRHIFATELGKVGVPIQTIKRLMRHSSIRITDETYTHLFVDDLKIALNENHPLIRGALTAGEILEQLEEKFRESKIMKDKRFQAEIRKTDGELFVRVKVNKTPS